MSSVFQLTSTADRPRLRPGERPHWLDVEADRDSFDTWRSAARDRGVPVDVWVSLLVELDLLFEDLRRLGEPKELLRAALDRDQGVHHLCRSERLRAWPVELMESASTHDDLPELLVPERVALRLTPGSSLDPRLDGELFELAYECEAQAAARCRTLESWGLSEALALCSSERPAPDD